MLVVSDAEARRRRSATVAITRCVNDNCQSNCDIGNTIWGQPGRIQECRSNEGQDGARFGWHWVELSAEESICEDGRIPGSASFAQAFNSATMELVRGGADASTQRCWSVVCANNNRFRGNPTTGQIDLVNGAATCTPCEGSLIYQLNTIRTDPTRMVLSLQRRR